MREHVRQNVVGYIALFCFVIGGTATALPGKNKVDSGDIKKGQVKTADMANGAVTNPKLGANAVNSPKVANDSLTGEDVNESTLGLPSTLPPSGPAGGDLSGEYPNPELGAGVVGDAESADRERRIVIPAGALTPTTASASSSSSFPIINYDPTTDQSAFAVVQIPADRVPGTDLTVRLLWSANGTGGVVWETARQAVDVSENVALGIVIANATTSSAVANALTVSQIPVFGAAIENGELLGLRITRDADNVEDGLAVNARLHAVEIRYTATG